MRSFKTRGEIMLVVLGWVLLCGLPLFASYTDAAAQSDPAGVRVWADREDPYRRGESARVYFSSDDPAHVTVFRVDTDGRLRVLFPREPWGDTFVRERRSFEVSGTGGGRSFIVDDYPGVGYLFVVVSGSPFDYRDITRGDYWDFRLIDGGRLAGDPYVLLTDLARRITPGGQFRYDIAPYYVDRRYEYPRFVCYECHAYASYEEWDPYERACRRFRVVIYDDPRYYPYRHNGGRNVVAERPDRPGPRFVFRDADPRAEYVTRLQRRRPAEPARTSEDVGGPGSVAAPSRRPAAEPDELRRPAPERRRPDEAADAPTTRPPKSTGEPELRRRRP